MLAADVGSRPLRAAFMRGGTSKGLMFLERDLPPEGHDRDALLLAAMGSPDGYGRQLNGMGGGVSSLSKVCVVGPTTHPKADIDYTFGQVVVGDAVVDYSGNCGNMSSAVGPFALMRQLIRATENGTRSAVIHNRNTGKLIRTTFPVEGGRPVFSGSQAIDGVSGTGASIRLDFLDPSGSRCAALLPTGRATDELEIDGIPIRLTLIDAATPCVFVDAAWLDMSTPPQPEAMDADAGLMGLLEAVRRRASILMGIARDEVEAAAIQSVPKVALVFGPQSQVVSSGRHLMSTDMSVTVRMVSMGKAHRALPITGAICLAAALRLPGSIPSQLARMRGDIQSIAHPSGLIDVDAVMDARTNMLSAVTVLRTARCLFDGFVYC